MDGNILTNLRELSEEKKSLLDEMLLLTQKQTNTIKNEELEELERLLDKKDSLIEKINDIDLKFRNSRPEGPIEDEALLNTLSQMNEVLDKMKSLDDENNKKLSQAITEMKGNLKDVRQGKRAVKNYGNADPYQAFASQGCTLFIDQDS